MRPTSGTCRTPSRLDAGPMPGRVGDLDRSGLGCVLSDVAFALKSFQVRVDGGWGCETNGIGDLTDARRVSPVLDGAEDEVEDLLLPGAEGCDVVG